MESRRTRFGHTLRLDPGEEIIASLTAFAAQHDVRAGLISGIGAVGETELGFFRRPTRDYTRRVFRGEHEVVALSGNFSELDGRPFPHCHLAISGEDFAVWGGHLFRAVVSVTCEIQIVTDPGAQPRRHRADVGFNALAFDAASPEGGHPPGSG